ncbi:PHD finger protein 7 [Clonorchis sinensis]|uniref:PHD finger protein 7 n=1 Tax=Clonorchis sinensis TaxID=79923 RepID=G7YCM7_CLOSI|nr:PHD finger protein 7 [Clonorchis sinensis]
MHTSEWNISLDRPSEEEIKYEISALKREKAPGPDGLYPALSKEGGGSLVTHLTKVIGAIWNEEKNLENWLKHCTEVPACCVCLFPMLPEENKSEPPPTVTKCKNKETDPPHSKVFTTPVNNRRLPRRTCMAMSTPKRVRVSVELSVRRLSTSNSSWEVSDLSVDPEPIPDEPTISSTTLCSSSRIHPALSHLPDWLKVSLSDKPDKQQLAAYDAWTHNSIHGLCCPKAWMHRSCIAGYAASAALHYLKCPYCAEKDVFIRSIIDAGIWVPDRDAAWELEPGAYADLAPADNSIASGSSESNSSSSPPSTSNPTPLQDSMQQNSTLRRSERRSVRPRKMSPSPDERHSPTPSFVLLPVMYDGRIIYHKTGLVSDREIPIQESLQEEHRLEEAVPQESSQQAFPVGIRRDPLPQEITRGSIVHNSDPKEQPHPKKKIREPRNQHPNGYLLTT